MSSVQERLQLKRVPLDSWNIREQLCLASAVVRSGDQNWMSVSRALKTVGDANRPPDWYSQKSCAAQYEALLDHVETPKRKKRSSEGAVETPQESILKRLTQERIVEIQKTIAEMTQQYEQLKKEVMEARNPSTSDERLREMWGEVEAAKRTRERENARRVAWLKEREERRARAERTWRPPAHTPPAAAAAVAGPGAPSSPLLTSLLKSSPVVTTPQHIPHPATVVETVSPSAGAPTLSMLLEKSAPPTPASLATAPPTPSLVLPTLGGSPTSVGVTTAAHDNKHAAIEHIKSQLVQIEQQLIASSSTPPPAVTPPAPAVDIDDIEIKAEDVYAFRDIDIHLPPVNTIHKPNVNRALEKPAFKKDDDQNMSTTGEPDDQSEQKIEKIKEEPTLAEMSVGEVLPVEFDSCVGEQSLVEVPSLAVSEPTHTNPSAGTSCSTEIKIGFPAPEIKVVSDSPRKIKEEVKETEIVPEPGREQDVDIDVEAVPAEEGGESVVCPAPALLEPPPPPLPPADIPLPDSPHPYIEPPLPPEPEPETAPEEVKQETEYEDQPEPTQEAVVKLEDDDKKDDYAQDTVPLKEMERDEPPPETEVRDVHPPEAEETHTETDDDTPMELSREEEKDGKKRRDYSRKKKPDSRTCSGSESAAEASAPESPSATDAEKQHRLWKKSVMLVYSRLCAHKYASLFLRPISDEEAPGYSLVIKRPMDLTTIRKNIESGAIRTTSEFQRDVLLMLSNALMYNSSEHSVYQMAKDMHEEAESGLGMLLAAHSHAGLVSPPARRKRRRHEPPPHTPPNT